VRVLLVIHTPKDPQTAVFKVVAEQAEVLRARGHSVEILAPQDFPLARMAGPRFDPLLFPVLIAIPLLRQGRDLDLIKFHSYSGWLFALLRPIRHEWRQIKVVTEFHGLEPIFFAALQEETRRAQRRLSWRYRLINSWFMDWIIRIVCRRSDRVLCLNTSELNFLEDRQWVDASNLALFKNGVPVDFFEIEKDYARHGATLLFVGQWNERKGIRYLVEAFAQVSKQYRELQLVCAGALCAADSVLQDFPADIRRRVTVHPRVTREELIQLHSQADIFIFPTLFEGSSLALLEAMASALPIVTTPVGAAPDILQDQTSALLVPLRDSNLLAAAVRELIENPTKRGTLGTNARAAAETYRSTSVLIQNAEQLEDLVLDPGEQMFAPDQISTAVVRN
jgi:glycosyltransferase involved in cell wall biosynthesis